MIYKYILITNDYGTHLSTFSNISENTKPIELEFHMSTPSDGGNKSLFKWCWLHDKDGCHIQNLKYDDLGLWYEVPANVVQMINHS